MPKINVLNQAGEKVGNIELSSFVFGITPHKQAMFDVVTAQQAAMRQGTSKVKNRSEVRGGGKKPWRQKGTGRARQGSIRSPQWRGGGVVFGPTPRKYNVKLNKKVKGLALRSALSHFNLENKLVVLEGLNVESGKTKDFNQVLKNLNLEGKTIFVDTKLNDINLRASQNLQFVSMQTVKHVSVYELLNNNNLVLTKDAAKALEEALANE